MTSASCSISLIWCSTGANCPAQRLISSPTVPSLICTPNRSLMTSQARASGSSWCCVRYTAIAPMVRYRCGVPDERHNLLAVLTPVFAGSPLPREPNRVIHTGAPPQSVAITNDGLLGFIALRGGKVVMLDLLRRQIAYTVAVGGTPHFIITGLYPLSTPITPITSAKAPAKQASTQGMNTSNIAVIVACTLAIAFLLLVLI